MSGRTGLRVRADKVDAEIGQQFKTFAIWLRKNCEFTVRVSVYLSAKNHIVTRHGEETQSSFFAPFDSDVEPFIRIATGNYEALVAELGEKQAVFSLLYSLALNIINYNKWADDNAEWDSHDADLDADILFQNYLDSGSFDSDCLTDQ